MPESKFSKSTDSEEKVKLDSALIYADWRQGLAYTGSKASFEIGTVFVGNGANIQVVGKSENGKKLGKINDTINNNVYIGEFEIADDIEPGDQIYFEVKLSKNGIDDQSNHIPVFPKPVVSNMKWSVQKASRGDIVTLSAEVKKVEPGTEATVLILEHDQDGAHDKIVELTAVIKNSKLELDWEYEYHEDIDDIPTQEEHEKYGGKYNPPEYFFVLKIGEFEYGKNQESGLLQFEDWIELQLVNYTGEEKYVLHLPDGSTQKGKFDDKGMVKAKKTLPGRYYIEIEGED